MMMQHTAPKPVQPTWFNPKVSPKKQATVVYSTVHINLGAKYKWSELNDHSGIV